MITADTITEAHIAALRRVRTPYGIVDSNDEIIHQIDVALQNVSASRKAREFLAIVWNNRARTGRLVITGKTITDEQIRKLLDLGLIGPASYEFATRALSEATRDYYRESCAEIINTRGIK